jgi:hypothetical protein
MLAVLLDAGDDVLVAYGPFDEDDQRFAERFALFLTTEVDPAWVARADEALERGLAWRSAMAELLNFYERFNGSSDG